MIESTAPTLFRVFLPVSDIERAVEFYQKLFGVDGVSIPGSRQYFYCGSVILAVVENSAPPIADHLYFAVSDVELLHGRAAELGCLEQKEVHGMSAAEIQTRPWGERSFYARDPFGNGLCFVDEQTLFTGQK